MKLTLDGVWYRLLPKFEQNGMKKPSREWVKVVIKKVVIDCFWQAPRYAYLVPRSLNIQCSFNKLNEDYIRLGAVHTPLPTFFPQ